MGIDLVRLLPARHRRPLLWGALALSPSLVVLATAGMSAAWSDTGLWTPSGVTAGDAEWLDTLTAPTARGADGAVVPLDPDTPVLPSGGDLQVLTLTQGAASDDADSGLDLVDSTPPDLGAPTVGDTTLPARLSRSGIPVRVLRAYVAAEKVMGRADPSCHLDWPLLAGIGRVESNHGRHAGSTVTGSGLVTPPILGPRLDGSRPGWATIRDTDGGRYDGDAAYDRAVGPMQFLPGTWQHYGADADVDGTANPQDVDDAALGTARYLCAGGGDLSRPADRWRAVLRYNHSASYAALVLSLASTYATGSAAPVPAPPADVTPPPGDQAVPGPTATSTAPMPIPMPTLSLPPLPTVTHATASPGGTTGTPTAGTTDPTTGTATSTATGTATEPGTATASAGDGATPTPGGATSGTADPTPSDPGNGTASATMTPAPTDSGTTGTPEPTAVTSTPADPGAPNAPTGTTAPSPADTTAAAP